MGFGNGYSVRTNRGGKSYNNQMTAHVWNAQSEERGQSSNGNFYFAGRALYSYGSHFVFGYIMPDGVAFLNDDSYSVSTSGHQADARAAVTDRRTFTITKLTDLAGDWKLLPRLAQWIESGRPSSERATIRDLAKRALREHAKALTAPMLKPGESAYGEWIPGYQDDATGEHVPGHSLPRDTSNDIAAGAYLADLAGLPAASWPKAQREAAAKAKRQATANARAERSAAEKRALQLADTTDGRFRSWIAEMATGYTDHNLRETGKDLKRARGLMLKAKTGKLAAAVRLSPFPRSDRRPSPVLSSAQSPITQRMNR